METSCLSIIERQLDVTMNSMKVSPRIEFDPAPDTEVKRGAPEKLRGGGRALASVIPLKHRPQTAQTAFAQSHVRSRPSMAIHQTGFADNP